jgi:dihydrofolate synthase/folylpolyglutamate synthase
MSELQSFSDVEAALAKLTPVVLARELRSPEHMAELMELLGNPQETYKVLHVAGTSGKTSTAYYAAAQLQAVGKRVGLNISPHAEVVNERVQINLTPLPEAEFCAEFSRFLSTIEPFNMPLNYFQVMTAFALWEFAQQKVEYAVVEVGIGGLADSTNVVKREDKVCVITDIGYGHMIILGNTLPEIAEHKAGVIQLHNTVFCRAQAPEIMQKVVERAKLKQADLHVVEDIAQYPFLPPFQRRNVAMATAATQYMLERDGHGRLDAEQLNQAARITIPARLEVRESRGKTVVLDAAHNPQKMHALAESLQARFPDKTFAVLFAPTKGQRSFYENLLNEVVPFASYLIVTSFQPDESGRFGSASPARLQLLLESLDVKGGVIADPAEAFAALHARSEDILVVTGSFYLLNNIRPLL